jgi:hypothetical protein
LITTFAEAPEIHPVVLVTVKKYVPEASPVMIVLFPNPVVFIPAGVLITVHVPVEGNPSNSTLPDGAEHDGCVMTPTIGGEGI